MSEFLTTDAIASADRVEWWREQAHILFGARYQIDPDKDSPFHMRLKLEHAPPLALLQSGGSAHRAVRQGDGSDAGKLVVHLQLEGHCTVTAEGRQTLLAPGHLTLHRVSESSDLHFHTDYRQICAVLPESTLDPEIEDWSAIAGTAVCATNATAAVLTDHLRSLVRHAGVLAEPGGMELASFTAGLVRATVRSLIGAGTHRPQSLRTFHIGRVKSYALAHLHDPSLDVDRIARAVGLSPRYIHRLFEEQPLPLMGWVMRERLQRAREQLERPGLQSSICDIAHAWGFTDHAHFTRSFRRHFGLSPREARLAARSGA